MPHSVRRGGEMKRAPGAGAGAGGGPEHARLHDDLRRHAQQIGMLREVVESISSELDLERLLQRIVAAAVDLLSAYGGAVGLAQPDGDALEIAALVNIPEDIGTLIPAGTGVMGLALASRSAEVVHEYGDLPAPIPLEALYHLAPWIAVPIFWQESITGVFGICAADPARRFSDADVELITLFAKHAGIAIENARLYQRSRELAITEERNRLAREIHDTLAQSLTGMVLQIEAVEDLLSDRPEQAREELRSLKQLARASLEEARRSVWGLRPPVLEEASLAEALERLLREESQAGAFSGRYTTAGRARPLTPAIEAGVYRIAQEALTNVRRHAQARVAVVQLRFEVGELVLIVQDDGRGIDPERDQGTGNREQGERGAGFGLTSMQERARLLGGSMRLESEPGRGTRVQVHVPYLASAVAGPAVATNGAHGPQEWPVRVLVADDNEVARHGIVRMLETHGDIVVVAEAAAGDEALARARQLRPDVVLVDLQMPGMGGIELIEAIARENLGARPIILTTFARDDLIMDGIRAGARGFLLKDITAEDLARAVRTVSRGGSLLQPVVATRLVEQIGRLARSEAEREQLTPRELDVLRLLVEGARNKEISVQLHISHGTVRFHVGNIFQKLNVSSRTEAVRLAMQEGLVR
jgi:signal transduction histidine kinase/DNA-binding NarL/FixJ family response regulator